MELATLIDRRLMEELSREAAAAPRLRKNLNFHPADESLCHRFLNAVEPGTYIRPHRHLEEGKDETMLVLKGKMGAVLFSGDGSVADTAILVPGGDACGIHIPLGVYHTVLSLERGTVFFETKTGPYRPLSDKNFASWAPAESSAQAASYIASLEALFRP